MLLPYRMTKISLYKTKDESLTLFNKDIGEYYHSTFGAIQESEHVFIQSGLDLFEGHKSPINIFEVGFGTGLNALLSYAWAETFKRPVSYQCVELYPITLALAGKLNYHELLGIEPDVFIQMHQVGEELVTISEYFTFHKQLTSLQEVMLPSNHFDLVFFDAFSPDVQPEMWSEKVFKKIASSIKRGGVLTTYSCKGIVKRAMKDAGFEIEKLPGPAGKREILRAFKSEVT